MNVLLDLLNAHYFDGRLHQPGTSYKQKTGLARFRLLMHRFHRAIIKNSPLYPQTFAYQVITLLEVTAILAGIWQWVPDYSPGAETLIPLSLVSLMVMRNNHYYTSCIANLSQEDMQVLNEHINVALENIKQQLRTLPFSEPVKEELLKRLTQPSFSTRLVQEVCVWASYLVKLGASFALLSAEFKSTLSLLETVILTILVGSIEGIDTAFTKVQAIGGEHRRLMEWLRNVIPPQETMSYALLFPKIADFSPIPWFMAKGGPLAWPIVKVIAAGKMLSLLGVKTTSVRGGLYGYFLVAMASSSMVAYVFSKYSIDKKLAQELPTKRTFEYGDPLSYWQAAQSSAIVVSPLALSGAAFLGASSLGLFAGGGIAVGVLATSGVTVYQLAGRFAPAARARTSKVVMALTGASPVAAAIGYTVHHFGNTSYPVAAVAAFPVWGVTTGLIICPWSYREPFVRGYRFIVEMRWPGPAAEGLDHLSVKGKVTMTIAGMLATALGCGVNQSLLTAAGELVAFLGSTALIAEKSRPIANAVRFTTAQMLFYAPALLEWVLNCVLPFKNLAEDHAIDDRPDTVDPSYFSAGGYAMLLTMALFFGAGAGFADCRSMAWKLPELTNGIEGPRRSLLSCCPSLHFPRLLGGQSEQAAPLLPVGEGDSDSPNIDEGSGHKSKWRGMCVVV